MSLQVQHSFIRVDDYLAKLSDGVAPKHQKLLGSFVQSFFVRLAEDSIADIPFDIMTGVLGNFWNFFSQGVTSYPKVKARNFTAPRPKGELQRTIVEIVHKDMSFLVESVVTALENKGHSVRLLVHPVFRVLRDASGDLSDIVTSSQFSQDNESFAQESLMHLQLQGIYDDATLREIETIVTRVLLDVRATVDDWSAMRSANQEMVALIRSDMPTSNHPQYEECVAFLDWVNDHHFTYLGYQVFMKEGDSFKVKDHLGLFKDERFWLDVAKTLSSVEKGYIGSKFELKICKTDKLSTVRKSIPMDLIQLVQYNAHGDVEVIWQLCGLFNSAAYNRSPRDIPLLRQKVSTVLKKSLLNVQSYDARLLILILEMMPRDELFQLSEDELFEMGMTILNFGVQSRVAFFARADTLGDFLSCLVYVPRDLYTQDLRQDIGKFLSEEYGVTVRSSQAKVTEFNLARIQYILPLVREKDLSSYINNVRQKISRFGQSLSDHLLHVFVEEHGEETANKLIKRYANVFPRNYLDRYEASSIADDIIELEKVSTHNQPSVLLYRQNDSTDQRFRIKVFNANAAIQLSDILPILENLDLKIVSEEPFCLKFDQESIAKIWIHDFEVYPKHAQEIDLKVLQNHFHQTLLQIFDGEIENDGFNKLILRLAISPRECVVFRAYAKYLRQIGIPFSQNYVEDILAGNASMTASLMQLFEVRFKPGLSFDEREAKQLEIFAQIERHFEAISNLDEDRIFKKVLNLIQATVRTNYYQPKEDGTLKDYMSFKFDSHMIEDMPVPVPLYEIFVYSPKVEAIHLRGGKVARGGIRWSDRKEDFRTEVLGLLKAQMIKNSVIVPVGSKGGFVVKIQPSDDKARYRDDVIECYKTMMRGLLDITDNIFNNAIIPPENVVRHDPDDPYLVVAADKGTATFSDIANSVSLNYNFWLGDAFASGGSAGYDHKKMGITAKGAWESVKRHFRELGKNIAVSEITAVGVGDMSGDVFGNGMLLSDKLKLVAAFNHMHIFVDPNPDTAKSFEERKRMFNLPVSTWEDYNTSLISKGGGIFKRSSKTIDISPEMKACLNIQENRLTPNQLMVAILKANVDLLWFGGIGTYVKSMDESHAEVGDRANDAIRVNASQISAKVIGEGANLGVTQSARIDFALAGGKINNDAVDNSAGVDCSDHEVNIKIMFGSLLDDKTLDVEQRNKILESMTDEVASLVLRDNYLQTQVITLSEDLSHKNMEVFLKLIHELESMNLLNRAQANIPDDKILAERSLNKVGLSRPELAVLLAHSKIHLYEQVIPSDLPDDPYFERILLDYFPKVLGEKYKHAIVKHRLRREITATVIANMMINRCGIPSITDMMERTNASAVLIAKAFYVVKEIFDLDSLWDGIESLDNKVSSSIQTEALLKINRLVERSIFWLLNNGLDAPIEELVHLFKDNLNKLELMLIDYLSPEESAYFDARQAQLIDAGVPKDLACRVAKMFFMHTIFDIMATARYLGQSLESIACVYFGVSKRLNFSWIESLIRTMPTESYTYWQKLSLKLITEELFLTRNNITKLIFERYKDLKDDQLLAWEKDHFVSLDHFDKMMVDAVSNMHENSLALVSVLSRQLKKLSY